MVFGNWSRVFRSRVGDAHPTQNNESQDRKVREATHASPITSRQRLRLSDETCLWIGLNLPAIISLSEYDAFASPVQRHELCMP